MFGIIPGGKKAKLHTYSRSIKGFAELLVDIYQIRIPDLNIMDAIIGMEGVGPTNGEIRVINRIISSDNGISLDSVMAAMMGIKPVAIELLQVAKERNLGETDISKIIIDGELEVISGFKTPNNGILQRIRKTMVPHIFNLASVKPIVNHNKCKICKKCIEVCPVSAMNLSNKFPEADRKKCISCFCCEEHCPYGAIILPSWPQDIFNRLKGK
jgi:NAD-dependent dihydropyrimidine dehydrogenase PreA subunit